MRTPEDTPVDPSNLIRFGSVESVDLTTGLCVVRIGDDIVSGGIRWIESRSGATRTWSPPTEGEQVLVLCPEGEIGAAVALRGIHQDAYPPAGSSLEELIEFSDGARIAYDPEAHVLTATLPAGGTANIHAEQITIVADVEITGDVTVQGKLTASTDVIGGGKSLKTHVHSGVQAGGAMTGAPA